MGFDGIYFPDTVVATGDVVTSAVTGKAQYEWVIEFQCREDTDAEGMQFIAFVGINFYISHNDPSPQLLQNMTDIANQQGLGVYLGNHDKKVPQTNCTYPWN